MKYKQSMASSYSIPAINLYSIILNAFSISILTIESPRARTPLEFLAILKVFKCSVFWHVGFVLPKNNCCFSFSRNKICKKTQFSKRHQHFAVFFLFFF